jgi:hypothetical protein
MNSILYYTQFLWELLAFFHDMNRLVADQEKKITPPGLKPSGVWIIQLMITVSVSSDCGTGT